MSTPRTYGDGCSAAYALDLIGDRWALLVVRELLCGAKRFSDLRRGLPNASPTLLTSRLRELEECGVVRRRRLGPPVGSAVYELTEWGAELRPVIVQLGRWASRSPHRRPVRPTGPDALMVALHGHFDSGRARGPRLACGVRLGEDSFVVRVRDRRLEIARGEPDRVDAVLETDQESLASLLSGQRSLDALVAGDRARIDGDRGEIERLLTMLA